MLQQHFRYKSVSRVKGSKLTLLKSKYLLTVGYSVGPRCVLTQCAPVSSHCG